MILIATPGNPIPDGAIAGKIKTADAIELRFARWDSPGGKRGTVCVFQGRTEFIEKYFETVNDLRQRGFAVATMDWRGQGHSTRGYCRIRARAMSGTLRSSRPTPMRSCVRSCFPIVRSRILRWRTRWVAGPLVRVAHSGKQPFERYVFSSPMIDLAGFGGSLAARLLARALRLAGHGRAVQAGRQWRSPRGLQGKPADFRRRALRAQCRYPQSRSDAWDWVADGGLGECGV